MASQARQADAWYKCYKIAVLKDSHTLRFIFDCLK